MVVEVSPCTTARSARLMLPDRALDLVGREHRAPFALDGGDLAAAARGDLGEQMAEAAEDRHQHLVAGRDQRDQNRFDAGARGAVDQQRPFVLGTIDLPQQLHRVVHIGGERRIELAEHRHRHGAQHARIDPDRAGAHQQAGRRIEFGERHRHCHALLPAGFASGDFARPHKRRRPACRPARRRAPRTCRAPWWRPASRSPRCPHRACSRSRRASAICEIVTFRSGSQIAMSASEPTAIVPFFG